MKVFEGDLKSPEDLQKPFDLLIGKKILRVGFHPAVREGGFGIDYEDDGGLFRIVFGHNDLGFWVVWQGEIGREPPEWALVQKIRDFVDSEEYLEGGAEGVELVQDPLMRTYTFVAGQRKLALKIRELKLLPKKIRCMFAVPNFDIIGFLHRLEIFVIDHPSAGRD